MQTIGDRIRHIIILSAIGLFLVFPIIWIALVSVQPGDVAYNGRYQLFPNEITFEAYEQALIENKQGIFHALLYSFWISSISTLLGMLIALSAVYLIKADVIAAKWKKRILQWSIGLYFLPVFVVFPGLKMLSQIYKGFNQTELQLIIVHTIFGFVIAFILLLLIYASGHRSYFEQLLLETGSRTRAFYYGIVAPQATSTLVVTGITFATIWSEFFLSNLITASRSIKPFSVVLQMAQGQYGTAYSIFAAGAVMSLSVWIFLLLIIFFFGLSILYLTTKKGKHSR